MKAPRAHRRKNDGGGRPAQELIPKGLNRKFLLKTRYVRECQKNFLKFSEELEQARCFFTATPDKVVALTGGKEKK